MWTALRIVDGNGDAMTAAGDATTVAGGCGTADCDHGHRNSTLAEGTEPAVPVRPVAGPDLQRRTRPRQGHAGRRRPCPGQRPHQRRRPHHRAHAPGAAVAHRDGAPEPDRLPPTMARVGRAGGTALAVGDVFAEPPDARRDLPNDLPATDRTCTLTARAENDDDEVIGPVASPALRPRDARRDDVTGINDCFDANGLGLADACIVGFTALRQAAERQVVPTAQQPEAERVTGRPDLPGSRHPAVWGQLPARDGCPAFGEVVSLLNCGLPFRGCRSSRGRLAVHGAMALPPDAPRSSATGSDRRALRMGVPTTTFTAVNAPRPQVGEANCSAKAIRGARRRADRESEPDAPDGPSPVPRIPRRNSRVPNFCCLL